MFFVLFQQGVVSVITAVIVCLFQLSDHTSELELTRHVSDVRLRKTALRRSILLCQKKKPTVWSGENFIQLPVINLNMLIQTRVSNFSANV